jgi:hypothetical protein
MRYSALVVSVLCRIVARQDESCLPNAARAIGYLPNAGTKQREPPPGTDTGSGVRRFTVAICFVDSGGSIFV